jgi:pimeloyl-ACP methyl ester carboxylesterase
VRAQRQALGVLTATLGLPAVPGPGRHRRPPAIEESELAGTPATVVLPGTAPPWPALVFANGATPDGRTHPIVRRLAIALGRSGYAVYIPDLPGVADGQLKPATPTAGIAFTAAVADADHTRDGRVALVGVSIGGTLALLVAADPVLAPRISVVSCIAPFSDLEKVMLLATTGTYRDVNGQFRPYEVPPALGVGLAQSLAEMLPTSDDALTLGRELYGLDPDSSEPLAALRTPSASALGPAADAVRQLLANADPERFDPLYSALPGAIHETVTALSPVYSAARIRAPVEIATAPRDRYFPVDESRALAAPNVRLTVTPVLAHATPRLGPRGLAGIARLNGFFVRSLRAAAT